MSRKITKPTQVVAEKEIEEMNKKLEQVDDEHEDEMIFELQRIKTQSENKPKKSVFDYTIPFGRYKNYPIRLVYKVDPEYIKWLAVECRYFKSSNDLRNHMIENGLLE